MTTGRQLPRAVATSELGSTNSPWVTLGTFAAAGDETTDLAVGERTYLTIVAAKAAAVGAGGDEKIVIYNIKNGTNIMRFRNMGLAAAGDHVYQIYTGARFGEADCAFVKRGTLTFKTGSQASINTGYEYADLLVVSNTSASSTAWSTANPGDGSELVAETMIDLQGDDTIVIVPTTLDDDSILEGKYY